MDGELGAALQLRSIRRLPFRWFDIAASRNVGNDFETRDNAVRNRDTVAAKMTPAQIAEAQKLAKAWKPN